jgi:hypothetical protein
MTTLSEQDYQKLLTFLHELYIPGNLKDFSARILAAIPKLVAADIPGYCEIDFRQDQFLDGTQMPGISSSRMKEVINQHFHEHPWVAPEGISNISPPYRYGGTNGSHFTSCKFSQC